MSDADAMLDSIDKIHALWLLLRPVINERALEFGATPGEVALALTIGTPTYVVAAAPTGTETAVAANACALFEHCCARVLAEGAN